MQFKYPYSIDGQGRTSSSGQNEHIHQLIEQVLFTSLGERINRPTFGAGLNQLLFAPNNSELTIATKFIVQGSLQQWLGNLINVEAVTNKDSTLNILVQYVIKHNQQRLTAEFVKEV